MSRIDAIKQHPSVQKAQAALERELARILEGVVAVQQIPAPTFAEAARAAYVEARMAQAGLSEVHRDSLGSVYGRWPGQESGGPAVVLSAHMDTVFPDGTDLTVQRNGRYLRGPGVGDNATGVAGLLVLAEYLPRFGLRPPGDIWFVANVGEEGLGDLRGMRAVVDRFGAGARYVVIEGGLYGYICHQAISVRRYRVDVTAPGGHSWGSFGNISAVHILGRLIAAIDGLAVPESPRTTYNVGLIQGGSSINSIAEKASLWLDLRSEEDEALSRLEGAVASLCDRLRKHYGAARIEQVRIGSRPAGAIPRDTPLVRWAAAALRAVGQTEINYMTGSTDTNVPLSRGLAAVCVGLTRSGNAHRLDEYIETDALPQGMGQLLLLTLAASGFKPRGDADGFRAK